LSTSSTIGDVILGTNALTIVRSEVLSGLGTSKIYICRLGTRVTVWEPADKSISGNLDCQVDAYVTTDPSGLATVKFQNQVYFDTSQYPTGMANTVATMAVATGGFIISAQRPSGGATFMARSKWWTNFEDIT
jgi:hypothetical protein